MKRAFLGLAIAAITFVALSTINTTAFIQSLIALPGAAGLVFALWELIKSNIEHQHRLEEVASNNTFVLSATSHMAERAFDKHVEFAEAYVAKTNEGLVVLFTEGPTKKALDIAANLYQVRKEYILWETSDVTLFLDKFERALRSMGANEHLLPNLPVGEKRSKVIEETYDTFKSVMDIKSLPNDPTAEIAISYIIDRVRDHLGITQLTTLRKHYLQKALQNIK